jgi:hypothetical protein
VERSNRTHIYEKDKVRKKIILMMAKLHDMYDYQYPIERRVIEERLNFLEREYFKFDYMINPYHVQPGLILDVDITSIKRKKATLDGMANVLNEFLHSVSKGFQDAAFASFSRRRSTVREDLAQSFGGGDDAKKDAAPKAAPAAGGGASYLDMLNTDDSGSGQKSIEGPKARRGAADAGAKPGRGRRKKADGAVKSRR